MDENKLDLARRRWKLLGQMLKKGKCNIESSDASISVRRFASFGLLKTKVLPRKNDTTDCMDILDTHLWYEYTSPYFPEYYTQIRHLDGTIRIKDLLGFNNTGNVCVWPAEEVLTYYALQRTDMFKDKSVIELGGGMTCLAGIALAHMSDVKEMVLTDGNDQSVENVDVVIKKNRSQFGNTKVSSRVLLWNDHKNLGELEEGFDIVIMADCLFFDEYRADLVNILDKLLKPQGQVLSFAPRRGETFKLFCDMAQSKFRVETAETYDDLIWKLHRENLEKGAEEYDPNIHYPLLMQLFKK